MVARTVGWPHGGVAWEGEPRRLLVDFLIGAHAELRAERLLTLDETRYAQHFPALKLMKVEPAG